MLPVTTPPDAADPIDPDTTAMSDSSGEPPEIDMLTYGEAMALFIATTPGPLSRVEHFTKRIAGADLNVATGLARLGFRVGYISRVGDDSFGRMILESLEREGIDARHVTIDSRHPTGMQLKAQAEPGQDPAFEYFRRGSAASHLSEADFVPTYVERARHLHLTGIAPAISPTSRQLAYQLARHFREAGKTVSFDPNLRPTLWPSAQAMINTLNDLAGFADWVLPGRAEGETLTGVSTPEGIADFYLQMGVRGVIVKLGTDGAFYAHHNGERGYVPAIPVSKVIDTVGAGDGFAVGVISALAEGATLEAATRRGALIGALAVQVIGDSEGLPLRSVLDGLEAQTAT